MNKQLVICVIGLKGAGKTTVIEGLASVQGTVVSWEEWRSEKRGDWDTSFVYVEIPDGAVEQRELRDFKKKRKLHRILCIDAPIGACSIRSGEILEYTQTTQRKLWHRSIADEMIINTCALEQLSWVIRNLSVYYNAILEIEEPQFSIF